MKCIGTVVESRGDIARVYIESNACDQCHACGFGAVRDKKAMEVNALNGVGAEEGDQVHLEVSGKKVMEASAILFLIPFAGFILGFLLGYFAIGPLLHARTASALITGFLLLAASYYLVYLLGNRSEFEFIIKEVLAGGETPASPVRPVPTN
jgi:sigma-E factor negative regulatory protein RseC